MTHIKRDSDCNANEKLNSEKQLEGKVKNSIKNEYIIKVNTLSNLQRAGEGSN